MPLIKAENISMSYEGKKVINSVSFSIEEGDCLSILGENGSGKTTILKALTGLKKIDSGTLYFDKGLKRSHIGYLPQQTDVQKDFPASVWEVVLSGCLGGGGFIPFYSSKQKEKAKSVMQSLEIEELSKKCYHELSGGQQQRVLLARALCASKKLLVLDEPTSALDSLAACEFYKLISKLNDEKMTIVMISHDIKNAVSCSNKVLHLGETGPLYYGNREEYVKTFLSGKEV